MLSGSSEDKIYFVTCGEYLKIGVAGNTRKRLAGLQTGCPYPLKLEATRENPVFPASVALELVNCS